MESAKAEHEKCVYYRFAHPVIHQDDGYENIE